MVQPPPITGAMWRLGLVIVVGAFMSGLDSSVVNTALPSIADDLDTSISAVQWVANGYLLAFAASLPAAAWVGRRIGVGRLWLFALAGFTLTSVLCALAPTAGWLVAARVLQGMTAGVLIPAGQTVLGQAVGPARLGRLMAALGVAVTLGPALGPVVGGLIVDAASWPWVFLVNLPLGAAGLVFGWRLVPRSQPIPQPPLDWLGLVLVSVGVPLLVYGAAAWGDGCPTAFPVWLPLVLAAAALAGFVRRSLTVPFPVTDLRLLTSIPYRAAVVTSACTGAALFGSGLIFPLYYQLARGADPLTSGLLLIALSLGTILVLPVSGRLVDRYGPGRVGLVGAVLTLAATLPFALLPVTAPEGWLQALLLLRGAAVALAVVPATTAAYKAVTPEQLPDATTQVNIVQRVGGALGGAIAVVVAAASLPGDPSEGFQRAFWFLTLISAVSLASACWLRLAERRQASASLAPAHTVPAHIAKGTP